MKKYFNFKFKIASACLCLAFGISCLFMGNASASSLSQSVPTISENYIRGVDEGLYCKDFVNVYTENIHGCEFHVYDINTNTVTVADVKHVISTGDYIRDGKNNVYTIVVTGDINGNGKVGTEDTATLKAHFAKTITLQGANAEAADTNNDGNINAGDYIRIKYHIQSNYNIHQNESFVPDENSSEDVSTEYNESGWTSGWQ